MSTAEFQIAYDGASVRAGSMDVYDLSPALLDIGDLVRETNLILNGENSEVSVRAQSDFKHGSFEISLVLQQGILEQARQLLLGSTPIDAETLVKVIFGIGAGVPAVVVGVIKIFKALKGQKPKQIIIVNNNIDNSVNILNGDSGAILAGVDRTSAEVYHHSEIVRDAVRRLVKPLSKEGIDTFEVRKDQDVVERITKEDGIPLERPAYKPPPQEPLLDSTREALLMVKKAAFVDGQKWRFSDGTATFGAEINDRLFMSRMDAREEGFFKGDVLRVVLRTVQQTKNGGGFKSEYIVEKVLDRLQAPQQQQFPDPEPE